MLSLFYSVLFAWASIQLYGMRDEVDECDERLVGTVMIILAFSSGVLFAMGVFEACSVH